MALPEEVRIEVVTRLASFEGPTEVLKDLKTRGHEVSLQAICRYDPNKVEGKKLSKKLSALFLETRKRYIEEVSDIPIAHQGYRLRGLQRMAQKAEDRQNFALAAQLYEQAAKERGGAYLGKAAAGVADVDVSNWTETEFLERIIAGEDPYKVAADRARYLAEQK